MSLDTPLFFPPFIHMQSSELIRDLNWRYATKMFDPTKKIPDDLFHVIMQSAILAPSSLGLQPWKFIVVNDPSLRASLREVSHGQAQITDASHLVVMCRREDVDAEFVTKHVANTAALRNVTPESLVAYRDMILNFLKNTSPIAHEVWTSKQVYIALGFMLQAAAHMGVDACPMEGFIAEKVDAILGLKEKKLASTVMCPLGYRHADDRYATVSKSRFSYEEVVVSM